jgi:hypothetical protein
MVIEEVWVMTTKRTPPFFWIKSLPPCYAEPLARMARGDPQGSGSTPPASAARTAPTETDGIDDGVETVEANSA